MKKQKYLYLQIVKRIIEPSSKTTHSIRMFPNASPIYLVTTINPPTNRMFFKPILKHYQQKISSKVNDSDVNSQKISKGAISQKCRELFQTKPHNCYKTGHHYQPRVYLFGGNFVLQDFPREAMDKLRGLNIPHKRSNPIIHQIITLTQTMVSVSYNEAP